MSEIEQQIKAKIEKIGTPLKDWDVKINYGIKTGYNEAFIIDKAKRDGLIKKSPNSAEIIRPILRGRDIKKYSYNFAELYLISTFPSLKIDIEKYPAVKEHLLSFGKHRLNQTGEKGSRKKTNNDWFETQDSISYWEDFYKRKIVWLELTDKPKFTLDLDNNFCLAGTFLLTGNSNIHTILSVLNSKLIEWLFDGMCNSSGVGTNQWKKFVVEKIPIPKTSAEIEKKIEKLINKDEFDILEEVVYSLYNLTKEEIEFIKYV
jgi:hypothetical protein